MLGIATPGIREYYLYHADQAKLSKAFSALRAIYRMEFETTDDIAWEQYGKYVSYDLMAPPNNGMHPSANSAALIVNLDGVEVECAAGDAGR